MTTGSQLSAQDRILKLHQAGYRQEHPCTCGPSSVSLIAVALGLEKKPEAAWLDPRFSRWMPVEQFTTQRGMALHEAQLTTELVYPGLVEVSLRRAYPENLDLFLRDLEDSASSPDQALLMNFAQDHLLSQAFEGQGSPHFSPVAGYDPDMGRVLVADVDIEVSGPYWVPVQRAFEGMAFLNPAFQIPRGWLRIRRRKTP